jgi:hypothetical protein
MAQQRLRPGPWKIINGAGSVQEIQIDYEKFDVSPNATVEFEVGDVGLYDDTNLTAFRNPVQTFTQTTNVGGTVSATPTPSKKVKP